MRIALLSTGHPVADTYPEGGGIQYQIQGLADALAERGHEVHVIARSVQRGALKENGVFYHVVASRGRDPILSVLGFSRRALGWIRNIDPDVLYMSERFSAAFPSKLPIPKVFVLHNYDAWRGYRPYAIRRHPANLAIFPLKNWVEERIMRHSERVVAPTRTWASNLSEAGFRHVVHIGYGVRLEDYRNDGEDDFLLFAGRLDRVKGVDILLRAYASLENTDVPELVLAGSGPHAGEFMRLVKRLRIADRVSFLGHVRRRPLRDLYATCTALVVPSLWEVGHIVAAEGMASGKPVIASDIPGPADYIENGRSGILFPAGDAGALADWLAQLLQDDALRRTIGNEARRRADETFEFQRVATAYEATFRETLEGAGWAE